jgi:hypothetical protein
VRRGASGFVSRIEVIAVLLETSRGGPWRSSEIRSNRIVLR